jgi:hypothetical protein
MLVDREPEITQVCVRAVSRYRSALLASPAARSVYLFALFLAIVIGLQWASGAYTAEFGGYPDEPAHYVTSLMLRDYIVGLNWGSPVRFAEDFYHHYPKVAFGHWPPFFYVVQALWMLVFSVSRTSIRLEIAVTTALLAYSVYREARSWFGGYTAPILAGLLTTCIPLVQRYTDEEMSDILLTLMCFWAAIFLARFLDSGRWRDSLLFGICFSMAVLTKGNGWLLAGVAVLSILLTRKLRQLFRWQFWIGPAVVGLLCLPWQLLTLQMAERGWAGENTPHYTLTAFREFGLILLQVAGVSLGSLALLGIAVMVVGPALRGRMESRPAVMFALILCTWIFHTIVPAGVEDRKMLIAVPALVLFIFAGGFWLADRLPFHFRFAEWRPRVVAMVGACAFLVGDFAIPRQQHYGYTEAARFITSRPDLRRETILVSDNSIGEGLLVSEIAIEEPRPVSVVVRGTKVLANVDWGGTTYRCLYSTPEQVTQAIDNLRVNLVVVDTLKGVRDLEHNRLLRQALKDSRRFQLIRSIDSDPGDGKGQILIYRVKPPTSA